MNEPVCVICGWRQSLHRDIRCADGSECKGEFYDDVEVGEVPESELAALKAALPVLTAERDKWLDLFNRSEQFQSGPTKRLETLQAALLVLKGELEQQIEDLRRIAQRADMALANGDPWDAGTAYRQCAEELETAIKAKVGQLLER